MILSMMDYMCWPVEVDYSSIVHIPHEYRLVLTSHLAVGELVVYEKLLCTLDRLWQPKDSNHNNKCLGKKFKKKIHLNWIVMNIIMFSTNCVIFIGIISI